MTDRLELLSDCMGGPLLVTHGPHVRWATGFTGSNGWLLVRDGHAHLLTDGRYRDQAHQQVGSNVEIVVTQDPLADSLAPLILHHGGLFVQETYLTFGLSRVIAALVPGLDLRVTGDAIERLVASKHEEQVDAIVLAQRIAEAVFADVIIRIAPGHTEQEIAAELVYGCLRAGAQRMAFEPIVASGPNSALPHARPTDRIWRTGEPLLIDMGCVVDGYASDMTRMLHAGAPSDSFHKAYRAVREAQAAAIAVAKPGVDAAFVDSAARLSLKAVGLGERFVHGLGHGIGLETHEWPRLSGQVDYTIPSESVVTIEPGVYLPGEWGIRIEDMIWVRDGGAQRLTRASADLHVV